MIREGETIVAKKVKQYNKRYSGLNEAKANK
jgi:hypothetical protein